MLKFLHASEDDEAKAIAIPWVFSKNSRARNLEDYTKNNLESGLGFQHESVPSIIR